MYFNKNNINILIDNWLNFREEQLSSLTKEDKKHLINFDEHIENIMNYVPENNKNYVKKQFDSLDSNFVDYVTYWNEKYYINGFKDAIKLILFGISDENHH